MGIKFESLDAIIFDLDDTLVDEGDWIEKRWEKTIEFVENRLGIVGFGESFWEIYSERGREYKKHVNKALERCGRDEQLVGEIVTFFLGQTTFEEPFSGVIEFLEEAVKKFKLGIITNGKKSVQIDRISRLGIADYFSSIVCAYEFPKPNPYPYSKGLMELGVEPSRSIYVSHDQDDFDGAKLSGMKTVHLNMSSNNEMENVDLEISDFSEFLEIIRSG